MSNSHTPSSISDKIMRGAEKLADIADGMSDSIANAIDESEIVEQFSEAVDDASQAASKARIKVSEKINGLKKEVKVLIEELSREYTDNMANGSVTISKLKSDGVKLNEKLSQINEQINSGTCDEETLADLTIQVTVLEGLVKLNANALKKAVASASSGDTMLSRAMLALENKGLLTHNDLFNLCKEAKEAQGDNCDDISRTLARQFFSDDINISKQKLETIANALEVCPAWLAFGKLTKPSFLED